ncbi:SCO6745 family protein [Micromonospora fluostatini]|uniref:SCO6745 family protein n=1 Tax=Micromonospora sp. JCM 30529 TaxID=3421643 RepID=UPI003D181347
MTPEQAAAASRPVVLALGEAASRSPGMVERARQLGISGWACYVAGRAGPLGEVSAGTVTAALGFVSPGAVAEGWDAATRAVRPAEVVVATLAECRRWGDEHLRALPRVDRLAVLLERAVAAADATGMPLFAAWREVAVPTGTPAARVAVGLRVLREHVVGGYLVATRAAGMTPLEAVLLGPDGEARALACGWPPPYPPTGPLVRRQLWAAAVTDRLVSPAFQVLTARERTELVELLTTADRQLSVPS